MIGPELAQDLEAVHTGQHYIQDNRIVTAAGGQRQAVRSIVGGRGAVSRVLQEIRQGGGQTDFIFYN